ncbi:hypothetical protein DFJ66_4259 [Saccharothrix variisporea]|uniref:Uncharacterized protein n=1 Tax=Saccharothrix variisporea TaxID=543527 RepID=A0A495XAF3_9PSEU|nr:hypothetical protein DFJ66_4259 [Saccharothrix variisporea]
MAGGCGTLGRVRSEWQVDMGGARLGVEVTRGTVEISLPGVGGTVALDLQQAVAFRAALDEAVAVARIDVREGFSLL